MIIAVDFDGILCDNKFPDIGVPNYQMISFVRELIDAGHEVILWTSRAGEDLVSAIDWCGDRGLHFCEVNENAPSNVSKYASKCQKGTRKVYADIYIDDHNPMFLFLVNKGGHRYALNNTIKMVKEIIQMGEEIRCINTD